MQTKISTTESSLLSSGLLFESTPPDGDKIDPPDNTSPQPEEDETPPEGQ
jgi:hypothetical protein